MHGERWKIRRSNASYKSFLDDMDYMKTEKYYETFLAKLNYARWKSDRGNFDEAECIYREGIEQRIRRNKTELLDEYIGEYAYNKYLKNNINEKQDVKDIYYMHWY